MSATGFLLSLFASSALFVPPNTMEWSDELCRYRGIFDSSKTAPDIVQNTVDLVTQGPAFFAENEAREVTVHPDFAPFKDRYRDYARYTQAIGQQKIAWLNSADANELKKPLLGRPQRPLCDRFVDLLAEPDLKRKMDRFLRIYPDICKKQGGQKRDCELAARVHVRNWTSVKNANLSLVGTDWNNCMIHYDEIHQLPRPELANLFQSIEQSDCVD